MVTAAHQIGASVAQPGPDAHVVIRDDLERPSPSQNEVLVKLEWSGVCHSDVHGIHGHTPMTTTIPGHEGVGRVVTLGTNVPGRLMHRRVGIKWLYSSCSECAICAHNYTACPNQQNTGRDVPGTFQQYIVAPVRHLTELPDQLPSDEVSPLLCAGLTMYSAIMKTAPRPSQWLVLLGAGGGLGHLGVQIARAKGMRVIAIDTGESKRELCLKLGATVFLDYRTDDVEAMVKEATGGYGAHALVCTASSTTAYRQALNLVRNLGVFVCIGLAADNIPISPLELVIRGLTLVGSSVGTETEMQELLEMAVAGEVKATVQRFDFDAVDEVVQMLARSEISGRAVLKIPP